MRVRKRPVEVDAVQWHRMGDHPAVVPLVVQRYVNGRLVDTPGANIYPNDQAYYPGMENTHGYIVTLEGGHIVYPGDWIITGVKGERYPCKPDIFAATYEVVS